ncbi:hypothetical protein JCM8208_007335 [Rhodotorula glutinis]
MPQRRPKPSTRHRLHAAAALVLLASSTASASFLTAPLDALRARAFLSPRAAAIPNTKAVVTYSNASSSLPTVVDTATAQGRYGHSAVYLPPPANELLLIGGQVGETDTSITSDVLRFRLASSLVWGADRPVSSIPDNPLKNSSLAVGLPASAWGAAAVDAQGRAWLIGGVTADCDKDAIAHVLSTTSSSSSTTSWTVPALAPRYPPRRRQASALAVANSTTGGTDVWVLGGIADSWTCSSDTIGYAGVDRYDTASGLVESMPWSAPGGVDPAEWEPPVSDYAAVVLERGVGILVVGGQGSDGHLADMAEVLNFDVATRSWTQQSVANLAPAPRMGHASVLLDSGSILIHGGLSSAHNVLSDLFLLSPSTSGWTWTQLVTSDHSEQSPALAYHSATQIVGGTIVVAFGIDGKTSAPSGDFWFLTVDEDAGTYTWTDQFGGNADTVAALEADAAATTTFAAKFAKKTFEVIANPKAQTSEAATAATVAPSLGVYGPPESEAPISAPGYSPSSSSSSRSSARTASSSSAAVTAAKSPSSSAASASASQADEAPTPKSTIIGASLGALGAVAAAGLLFFLVRRRAAQGGARAPSSPVMGSASRADGTSAPPLVSQLMYTRRAQARNMSLGSTLSALSPRAVDLVDEGSPNMAGIGAATGASPDPFNDAYRVTEVGQLERAGSAASGTSSTGGVVGAVLASVSGLVAPQQQHGDTYTSPAPTLSAKRSLRRPAPPLASLPVPGTPAELIGMAITSDDGHDGLPYVASSASSAHSHNAAPAAAAAGPSSWDPARSQRPLSAPPASSSRDARTLDLDASPVPAILRPGTPLRVANPDPFADQ